MESFHMHQYNFQATFHRTLPSFPTDFKHSLGTRKYKNPFAISHKSTTGFLLQRITFFNTHSLNQSNCKIALTLQNRDFPRLNEFFQWTQWPKRVRICFIDSAKLPSVQTCIPMPLHSITWLARETFYPYWSICTLRLLQKRNQIPSAPHSLWWYIK